MHIRVRRAKAGPWLRSTRSAGADEGAERTSWALQRAASNPTLHYRFPLLRRPKMPSATSSQTIGPFWHLVEHPEWADLTRFGAVGHQVTLTGTIIDGDGDPVTDAAVELWQADPPADARFPGLWTVAHRRSGQIPIQDAEAGAGSGPRQRPTGASLRYHHPRARPAQGSHYPRLFRSLNETDPLLSAIEDPGAASQHLARPTRWCGLLANRHPPATRRAQGARSRISRCLRKHAEYLSWTPKMRQLAKVEPCP